MPKPGKRSQKVPQLTNIVTIHYRLGTVKQVSTLSSHKTQKSQGDRVRVSQRRPPHYARPGHEKAAPGNIHQRYSVLDSCCFIFLYCGKHEHSEHVNTSWPISQAAINYICELPRRINYVPDNRNDKSKTQIVKLFHASSNVLSVYSFGEYIYLYVCVYCMQ